MHHENSELTYKYFLKFSNIFLPYKINNKTKEGKKPFLKIKKISLQISY